MGQLLAPQVVESPDDVGFFQLHERIAVGFLVAGVGQGVERQGVVLGGGEVFLHQAAEHPGLCPGQVEFHTVVLNIEGTKLISLC